MGRDRHERDRAERLAPFLPVLKDTMDAPAWRAMSHGAKILYLALKRRVNKGAVNNGRVYLSQREASDELKSHHDQICRWFRELEHFGFIVKMTAGRLGVEGKGVAPHWRLTELGFMRDPPTEDFKRWNGTAFRPAKTESRAGKAARCVQENRHSGVQEIRHGSAHKCAGKPAHREAGRCAGKAARTKITTTVAPRPSRLDPLFLLSILPAVRPELAAALLVLQSRGEGGRRAAA